jgi:hypothetical protein
MTGMSMQITRLRVEQLRRFRQPLELAGFEPGLNILAGPNEAGKSTLVRAIRAAFFERHKSSAVDDLRPWGEGSGAAPRVELDFTLGGQEHRLVKSFLGKKRCTLAIGAQQLDGADAEDHLARLFGFGHAARGESKPEHWGIPGLLWVQQGTGQEMDVRHARDHLHDALQGQVDTQAGALAATGGDALLEQLRAQRGLLLTATGKPRAELLQAEEAIDQARQQLATLDAQIGAYRQQVDQLATLQQQHAADAAERPWDALDQQLAETRQRQATLAASQQQLAQDRQRLAELERTRQLLTQGLAALDQQDADASARAHALAQTATRLQAADTQAAHAQQQATQAARRAQAAAQSLQAARAHATRNTLQQQCEQARRDAARDAEALARAQAAHAQWATLQAEAAALPSLNAKQLQQLRTRDRALADATLQRQAVATRLAYALPPGQRLALQQEGNAQWIEAQGERLLDAPATLQLPGGGTLTITPGGQDLASLARAHSHAAQALQAALEKLGLADLQEAEARLAAHTALQARLQLAEQALAIVAPRGLDALQAAATAAQARIASADAALARLPVRNTEAADPGNASGATNATDVADATDAPDAGAAGDAGAASATGTTGNTSTASATGQTGGTRDASATGNAAHALPPIDADCPADTLRPLAHIEAEEQAAADTARTAQDAWAQAQRQQAAAQSQHDAAQRELQAAQAALTDPARQQRRTHTQQQLLDLAAEQQALQARANHASATLHDARPELVAQDIERLQRSVERLLQGHQQRHEQILVLQSALQQAGAQGLEEQRAAVDAEHARATRRHDELRRRAAALDLLCRKLDERRQATLARLQAPLTERLAHYLPLLLPGARVQMDEQLAPSSLSRPGADGHSETGQVADLSFGAREQLGLISRFAYADLLRTAGRPTLLILDDALVHSDAARLAQMKRVLFDAAQRHQVLLFTCHPEWWRDMGVAVRTF